MSKDKAECTAVSEAMTEEIEQFIVKNLSEIESLDQKEIVHYVEQLHKVLQAKDKILRKYKHKIKDLLKEIEDLKTSKTAPKPQTQTEVLSETKSPKCSDSTAAVSLVDEIRQAAEQAQNLSGFVYEPTSGLYYDQKTGYYYNAEYGLYYDGNTGCYYNYNQDKNVFEFHSQVEVQPNQAAAKDTNVNDKNGGNGRNGVERKACTAANNNVADDDDDIEEVQFDEHGGVITDKKRLRALRKEKRKRQRELEKAKKRKKKSKKAKSSKESKSNRKRRKSRYGSESADEAKSDGERNARDDRKRDIEEGELSDSSSSSSASSSSDTASDDECKAGEENDVPIFKAGGRFQDIAKKYPPSLRIIVQETSTEGLKVGSLSLITFKGGSLGREGNHDVIIPDVNVSKCHLEFSYDKRKCVYKCIDLGSQNGTILNGERMSAPKETSDPYDLVHGSVIQIGQTKLLCHTHEGNSTCGLCEPGLLIEANLEKDAFAAPSQHLTHKEQLKRLQKKYGLENEKFVENKQQSTDGNYNDRAATRRIKVGSYSDKEKTQTASLTTPISSENKGFKMLSKLGWSEGEALGKSQSESGLLEPINVQLHDSRRGLGCDDPPLIELTNAEKRKIEASRKMQERYQKSKDIFDLNDDKN